VGGKAGEREEMYELGWLFMMMLDDWCDMCIIDCCVMRQ